MKQNATNVNCNPTLFHYSLTLYDNKVPSYFVFYRSLDPDKKLNWMKFRGKSIHLHQLQSQRNNIQPYLLQSSLERTHIIDTQQYFRAGKKQFWFAAAHLLQSFSTIVSCVLRVKHRWKQSSLLQQENHPGVWKLHRNMERTAKEKQKFTWLGKYGLKVMFCKLTFEPSWIKWYLKQQTAAAVTACTHLTNANINNRGIKRVGVEAGALRWTWATESFGGFVCWNWSGAGCEPQESDLMLSLFTVFLCQNKR